MKPEDKKFALNLFLEIDKVPDRGINTQVKYFSETRQTRASCFFVGISLGMFHFTKKKSSISEFFYEKRM